MRRDVEDGDYARRKEDKRRKEGREVEGGRGDGGRLRQGKREDWIQSCRFSCITFLSKLAKKRTKELVEGQGLGLGGKVSVCVENG